LAQRTNPDDLSGTADELLAGADVLIGVSAPGTVSPAAIGHEQPDADHIVPSPFNHDVVPAVAEAVAAAAVRVGVARCAPARSVG
jgi:malic enzyme